MKLEMDLSLEMDKRFPGGPSSDVRTINHMPLAVAGSAITEGILIYGKWLNSEIAWFIYTEK